MDEGKASIPQDQLQLNLTKIMPSTAKIAVSNVSEFIKPCPLLRIQLQNENGWSGQEKEDILSPGPQASSGRTPTSGEWELVSGPAKGFQSWTSGINCNSSDWQQASKCVFCDTDV